MHAIQLTEPPGCLSPVCGQVSMLEHRAGFIVSCMKHHSSWQSRLQSIIQTRDTDFSEAICLCLLVFTESCTDDDSLHPMITCLFCGGFLHSQLVSFFTLHVRCGREINTHWDKLETPPIHLFFPSLHPSV